jgi:polysaccharide pyruvyl transferase WcaK-like protein
MNQPITILILCGDADHNLGDRAILQATCQMILRRRPDARIIVVSGRPEAARHDYGAEAIGRGPRGFLALCRSAAAADLVLCGGGGLFQDDDSLVKMPYWAARVLLARSLCRRVIGHALGVGPLRAATSRWAARLAFALMERVSVRDERARALAQGLSRRPVEVVPDPALALEPGSVDDVRGWLRGQGVPVGERPIIGVAPRRWFPPAHRIVPHKLAKRFGAADPADSPEGRALPRLIAQVLDRQVAKRDAHILFLPTYCVPSEADDRLCAAIRDAMQSPRSTTILRLDDAARYKAVTASLDVMLGGRMHPMILSASMGTPVVGLAYNPKFHGLLALLGQGELGMDVAAFVRDEAVQGFDALLDRAIERGRLTTEPARPLVARIEAFVDDVLGARS